MNKSIRIIFISIVLTLSVGVFAQTTLKDIASDLSWGGNLGMSFGDYTFIQVAPVLYYNVNEEFIIGGGLDYTYYNTSDVYGYIEKGSIWSPRLFARYFVLDDIFVHAEYQQYYSPGYNYFGEREYTWSQPYYYAGVGYRQWMGDRSYAFVMLLFDLTSEEIIFGINPKIQMGFSASFN